MNCTLNSEKDFDSSEVEWTKLNSLTLPADSQSNIEISDDRLLLNIKNIADNNAGVYALYIPSTATSELVEVILYSEYRFLLYVTWLICGGTKLDVLVYSILCNNAISTFLRGLTNASSILEHS